MTIRQILQYPDPRLNTVCSPVTIFDDELAVLVEDLLETMRAAPGVGITAAHIGDLRRVSVIELSGTEPRIHINPEILSLSGRTVRNTEGSVSMPGATEEVERPDAIRFRYQDLHGVVHEEDAAGFLAICIQHEVDQLNGNFWLRKLSRIKRDRLVRKWEKSRRA